MTLTFLRAIGIALSILVAAAPVAAQAPQDDPDLDINFAQPDFTLVTLPTTLRVPKFKSAFRVTHALPVHRRWKLRRPRR